MTKPMTDELGRKIEDLCPCVDCEGLHHYSVMVSTTVDPDGDPICPACVKILRLREENKALIQVHGAAEEVIRQEQANLKHARASQKMINLEKAIRAFLDGEKS